MQYLWHDYETFGTRPALDRPCQFAAQRTDENLDPVGEPVEWFCAPADDVLPRPFACLITGITPQTARKLGKIEAEFARDVLALMMQPGTCSVGYNSLKFDDEVTRHLFYRNLLDPYEREYRNGNSRWDLINLTRMCYALRPEGIEWPMTGQVGSSEVGGTTAAIRPSFRLQDLTRVNGIDHADAHNALADVRATIELARIIRKAQPRLYDWSLSLRDKQQARRLLDFESLVPVVHSSGHISSTRGCTSVFLPIAPHPRNDKSVIVFDLMGDAQALAQSDAQMIHDLVFTPHADLPEEVSRLPLKQIKWNAVPMLAPLSVLQGVDEARIGLDLAVCHENAAHLRRHIQTIRRQVRAAFDTEFGEETDPDFALYSGFFNDSDRRLMQSIQRCSPEEIAGRKWQFDDHRLSTMLLRYRARNWPRSLSNDDWATWRHDRRERLLQPAGSNFYGLEDFRTELSEARLASVGNLPAQAILDELEVWSEELELETDINHL